jgi:hypothetical protein
VPKKEQYFPKSSLLSDGGSWAKIFEVKTDSPTPVGMVALCFTIARQA